MTANVISLNGEQRLVAENHTDSILLLAGAGTGKTGTLAARVAALLQAGVAPQEILCLSFTNRACREMLQRVAATAPHAADAVTVCTVHSFCARFLRQLPRERLDFSRTFAVCDEQDARDTIRAVVLEATGKDIEGKPVDILQAFLSLLKQTQLQTGEDDCRRAAQCLFEENRAAVEKFCRTRTYEFDAAFFSFLVKYGASITMLYDKKLRESNLLDFDDLLLLANRAMRYDDVRARWAGCYRYVHVDEAQDMSFAEYRFLTQFCENARLMLCGDFHQTIYEWRGSNPQALQSAFRAEFAPVEVRFSKNYRAGAELIDLASNLLYHAFGEGNGSALNPARQSCTQVVMESFETPEDEVAWIYRQIQALNLDDPSRCAVLTRNNQTCKTLCDYLKLRRVKETVPLNFMLADELRLFRRAEIKDVLACLRLVQDASDEQSMRRLACRLTPGVNTATLRALAQAGGRVRLTDFLHRRTERTGDYFAPLLDALETGHVVVFDVESTGTDVFGDDVIQIAALRLTPQGETGERFVRFLRVERPVGTSEAVHGFSDAYLREHGEAPQEVLEAFLDFVEGCVIVGHNVRYDMVITAQNLLRYGMTRRLDNVWYDTLDLSRRFLPELENHKLATVAEFLGTHTPTHDAWDDICATAGALCALVSRFLRPQTEERRMCYAKFSTKFAPLVEKLRTLCESEAQDVCGLLDAVFEAFALDKGCDEVLLANRLILRDFAAEFVETRDARGKQIATLLELTALTAGELDRLGKRQKKIPVITVHQSKGCEFDYVFMPMLRDGVFPSYQTIQSGNDGEEKRVFYVAVTRARKRLYMSWSHRNERGSICEPSRFLRLLDNR